MRPRARRIVLGAALALLAPGAALLAREAYLNAKAHVAVVLIERAWRATVQDGRPHPPWSWADVHPVAKLRFPRLGVERTVLSSATGSALAFGLGHLDGTALPGGSGSAVVAGHRDSWAAFLQEVELGDDVVVETRSGTRHFRVASLDIVRRDRTDVLAAGGDDHVVLVTCWPFGGFVGGPWRYVVTCAAERHDEDA